MSAAGRGVGSYARGSTIGQAAKSGVDAARKYFGVGENQQAPTVTGLASSAKQGMKQGAQNIRQGITTGAHAVASVAKDVARDISKYSPIK